MAKNERKLSIVVSVKDQTKKAMGGIGARIKRFSEATSKAIAKAFKVGLAAAAVALAAFTAGIKKQFTEIDLLAKTAFRFGVAIENIRGLELAGKLAGLSLSEMTTILRDTSRRVSEAAQGTGEAQDAIKELGLDAKALNLMPVERQLDIIVKELGEVENANDRVRMAYDIMGRSGTQGLTLIGTSITGAIQDTKMLGTALDEEIAASVQDANDQLTRMKESFKGLVQEAVGGLAPVLADLFKDVRQFMVDVRLGIKAMPLAVEVELLKIKQTFRSISDDIKETSLGGFLFGGPTKAGLFGPDGMTAFDPLQDRIDELNQMLNDLASQRGNLVTPGGFPGVEDAAGDGPGGRRRTPTPQPGLVGGRLLTGAAQSSAERLAAIQKEADAKRAKEAADAKKQRADANKLLADLLRSAVQGPSNLGGLLQ